MDVLEYFSGQGKLYLAQRRTNGTPGPLSWVGDALMHK